MCYDYKDGMPACRAAFIFSAMGFKEVRVLNTAFGTHYKKEEKEQKSAKQAGVASEIKLDDKFFATSAEVKKIVDGSSSD